MNCKKYIVGIVLLFLIPEQAWAQAGLADMNSWLEAKLAADNTSLASYLFLFLGGILASLLPCVYPLYPITANIIQSRGSRAARFVHPITYFLGLAFMYLLFGLVASVSGGAFNTVIHYPMTNLVIGLLIMLMGLSAAGLLHIPFFGGEADTKQQGLPGTFLLGMGAGLLASSCVGPIVVSILIGLASSVGDTFSLWVAFVSSLKMLAFGLGLGIPFLLIGVFGVSLPKSGTWMRWVQYALGAVIVWFGWTYLEKALSLYSFSPEEISLIGLGALILVASIYFYQSSQVLAEDRMKKALWSLSAIIGILVLARGMVPVVSAGDVTQGHALPRSVNDAQPAVEKKGELTWYLDKEAAYQAAQKTGKNVFIDFYASWCTNCKEFEKLSQQDEALTAALDDAILLKVYHDTDMFRTFESDSRYPELKVGLPLFVITDPEGNLVYKTTDYLKTEEMALFLE